MAIRSSAFIATSLDGFIARVDGSLDWLPQGEDEDYGYTEFYRTTDVVVMGRKTFATCLTFDRWPHREKRVVVMSRGGTDVPDLLRGQVEVTAEAPRVLMARLETGGAAHAYVDGGMTIRSFLAHGLLHEITITTVPVLLGQGIQLFGDLEGDLKLHHRMTRTYSNGLVQSRYEFVS